MAHEEQGSQVDVAKEMAEAREKFSKVVGGIIPFVLASPGTANAYDIIADALEEATGRLINRNDVSKASLGVALAMAATKALFEVSVNNPTDPAARLSGDIHDLALEREIFLGAVNHCFDAVDGELETGVRLCREFLEEQRQRRIAGLQ